MTETTLAGLRQILIERYDEFKTRLMRRLGSIDLVDDALQDTWLRLAETSAVDVVRNPTNYLLRTALNVAWDRRRSDNRLLTAVEIHTLLDLSDETPDPAQAAEARSDLRILEIILAELSPRQREILLAARVDNMPRQEIADRLGVSLRLVSKELHLAQEYCLARRKQLAR
jgi:RNA polymerase sigma-70 factor (ECF subfamily)